MCRLKCLRFRPKPAWLPLGPWVPTVPDREPSWPTGQTKRLAKVHLVGLVWMYLILGGKSAPSLGVGGSCVLGFFRSTCA